MLKNSFDPPCINTIYSYGEKEYQSLKSMFQDNGIQHLTWPPYTPQHICLFRWTSSSKYCWIMYDSKKLTCPYHFGPCLKLLYISLIDFPYLFLRMNRLLNVLFDPVPNNYNHQLLGVYNSLHSAHLISTNLSNIQKHVCF